LKLAARAADDRAARGRSKTRRHRRRPSPTGLCISEHTRATTVVLYAKLEVSGRLGLQAFVSQHRLQGMEAR
jgi:hypothetical protein